MKKLFSLLFLCLVMGMVQAQIQEPVKFKTDLKTLSGTDAEIVFTAVIDKGWHVYSTDLGDGGPISATFNVDSKSGVEVVGKLKPVGKEVAVFDKLFEMNVRYFENTAQFVQKIKLTGGAYSIEGYMQYGACNDENCLPPTDVPFKFSGESKVKGTASETPAVEPAKQEKKNDVPAKEEVKDTVAMMELVPATVDSTATVSPAVAASDWWEPVISELQALGEKHSQKDSSWIYIFITGFLGGLLALLTHWNDWPHTRSKQSQ